MAGLQTLLSGLLNRGDKSTEIEEQVKVTPNNVEGPSLTDLVLTAAEKRGVGSGITDSNLNFLIDTIGFLESKHDPKARNPDSEAKGEYQWLTEDGSETKNSSIQTALNRAGNYYTNNNLKIPRWITKAKKHQDPRNLTRHQQKELFLADIFERKGSDKYLKKVLDNRDRSALKKLYMNIWHTKPSRKLSIYVDGVLFPAAGLEEPITMAALQDDTMALAHKGGMVYKNYHKYKPRAI